MKTLYYFLILFWGINSFAQIFHGNFIKEKAQYKSSYKSITYNIKFGEKIEEISTYLYENHQDVDFIFLQEAMGDLDGKCNDASKIAKILNFSYVYVPSTTKKNKFFGVAILSRYNFENFKTFEVPHQSLTEKYYKKVLRVDYLLEGKQLSLTSTHNHPTITNQQRVEQVEKILIENTDAESSIIAGDFNSFLKRNREQIFNLAKDYGFRDAIEDKKWTFKFMFIKFRLDLVLVNNLEVIKSEIDRDVSLSDHKPVIFKFKFI